ALQTRTSLVRWAAEVRGDFSGASAPAFSSGSVFAADREGGLYRFDAKTGKRLWDYQFASFAQLSAPVVARETVYEGLDDGTIAAVSVRTGRLRWRSNFAAAPIGPLAPAGDLLLAAGEGTKGGLLAFQHDPAGVLVDQPSPSSVRPLIAVRNYAAAEPRRRRPSNRGRTTEGTKASRAPARPTRSGRAPAGPHLRLPPFLPTFSRGLLGVGSNPLILPSAFLGALAVWGIYASFRSVRVLTPSELAQILALPPIHSLLDLRLIFGGGSLRSAVGTLALAGLLLLVRAALFAFLIALSFETLGGDGTEPPGYRPALRRAATRTAT